MRPPFPSRLGPVASPVSVFFGTSEFAVPSLRALAAATTCALVVTQPDRPGRRGQRLQATPVKLAAQELGLPTFEPERLRDAVEAIAAAGADLFAVASYGKIVPQGVLDLVPIAFNVHPSLLPLYRGATPLQTQIRDGVRDGGVSIIAMDAGMDTGDVVAVRRAAIGAEEPYGTLHDRLAILGAELLAEALAAYAAGTLVRTPQSELGEEAAALRTVTRPLSKDDLRVSLTWSPERIASAARALSPQPLARVRIGDDEVKIARARVATGAEHAALLAAPPVAVFAAPAGSDGEDAAVISLTLRAGAPGAVVVSAPDASLVLERVVPPNRGEMPAADYLRSAIARVPSVRS